MKTLTLSLKKKWFDMIKSGIKKEEYRDIGDYWFKRFRKLCSNFEYCFVGSHPGSLTEKIVMESCSGLNCDRLVFTLGYPKKGDTSRRIEFKNPKIKIGEGRPEWGAEPGKKYFVITWEE